MRSAVEQTELTDDEIRRTGRAILEGRTRTELGCDVGRISFVEDMDVLPEPKLAFLYKLWLDKADPQTGLHNRADFDMLSMLPAVGNIMILDVLRNGFDARYRLYGTEISDFSSRDWTGQTVSEMNRTTQPDLALMYRSVYWAVYESNRPIYSEHLAPVWLSGKIWRRLVLPVSYGGDVCEQFIVGNIPVSAVPADSGSKDRPL
ncbi:hypothetical protein [Nisaea sp.]|uniref:hypothetical protein n=1 Tax=Nisaea sp. TaxID=2024842 RepID=UPI003263A908